MVYDNLRAQRALEYVLGNLPGESRCGWGTTPPQEPDEGTLTGCVEYNLRTRELDTYDCRGCEKPSCQNDSQDTTDSETKK